MKNNKYTGEMDRVVESVGGADIGPIQYRCFRRNRYTCTLPGDWSSTIDLVRSVRMKAALSVFESSISGPALTGGWTVLRLHYDSVYSSRTEEICKEPVAMITTVISAVTVPGGITTLTAPEGILTVVSRVK